MYPLCLSTCSLVCFSIFFSTTNSSTVFFFDFLSSSLSFLFPLKLCSLSLSPILATLLLPCLLQPQHFSTTYIIKCNNNQIFFSLWQAENKLNTEIPSVFFSFFLGFYVFSRCCLPFQLSI